MTAPLLLATSALDAPALGTTAPWLAPLVVVPALVAGAYVAAALDELVGSVVAGTGWRVGAATLAPLRRAAGWTRQAIVTTERPDALLWLLAPALYAALAAIAVAVIPFGADLAVADVRTGIVVFGAAETALMVAVYLAGWSANAPLAIVGGYRFIALGLSFLLLEMFVLIGVALPAQSLAVGQIIASQQDLWNVVRQPLGLPLFLVVALGAAFWGPFDLADGRDLAGGTGGELSGRARLAWELARRMVLVSWSAMAAAAFLGGYLGPWLPGPVWMALKTLAVLVVLVTIGHHVGRIPPERTVRWLWTILLPLAFLDLLIAGVVALA